MAIEATLGVTGFHLTALPFYRLTRLQLAIADGGRMARSKDISAEALAALGTQALSETLVAHAATDTALRKKLGMMLAAAKGAGSLAGELDKRLKTIARSRSFVDWDKRKTLSLELDHLRTTIATRLAESDPTRAIELLWDFAGMGDGVLRRIAMALGKSRRYSARRWRISAGSAPPQA